MITISKDTNIYVYCPGDVITGGAELLHQLVDVLRCNGHNAYIVYYGSGFFEIPADYRKYDIKTCDKIVDSVNNIVVVYEGYFNILPQIQFAQKILWWLSVDNYFLCSLDTISIWDIFQYNNFLGMKILVKRLAKLIFERKNKFSRNISLAYLRKLNVVHAYQSVYAQKFLLDKKFESIIPLTDYINLNFTQNCTSLPDKEDIIAYNPKKGMNFTKKLIRKNPTLKFVPIQKMNRQEVGNLLLKSKVYIDFGFHPGKDRLPREAVLSKCVVVTSTDGSAHYFEDVPLDSEFKVKRANKNIKKISSTISNALENYMAVISKMDFYRYQVICEREKFNFEVKKIFGINSSD